MNEVSRFLAKENLRKTHDVLRHQRPPLALFNYDLIGRHMVCDGFYELTLLDCLAKHLFPRLGSRALCLDVGANVGNHSAYFADQFDRVIAFEPNRRAFYLLQANAMLFDNIEPRAYGLSSTEGTATATYDSSSVGAASISIDRAGAFTTEFQLKRLDDVLSDAEKSQVSFVKIDVEGHELEVLQGARDTIRASKPVIVLEALQTEIEAGTTPPIEFLRSQGYAHLHILADTAPFARTRPRVGKLLNTLSVLVRNRKILEDFELVEHHGALESRNHAMIVMSCDPL